MNETFEVQLTIKMVLSAQDSKEAIDKAMQMVPADASVVGAKCKEAKD